MPFFTDYSPNLKAKGSVDPLGFEALWSQQGRRIIKNLTTITDDFYEFQTTLCGLALAEQYCDGDTKKQLEIFLRFEQWCAYARSRDPEVSVRGTTRVRKAMPDKIIIDPEQGQILSNQKQYGLWGLYTVAVRNTGWVEHDSRKLTPEGRGVYNTVFKTELDKILTPKDLLENSPNRGTRQYLSKNKEVFKKLEAWFNKPRTKLWKNDFARIIIQGGIQEDNSLQTKMFQLIQDRGMFQVDRDTIHELTKSTELDHSLREEFIRIEAGERVFSLFTLLFETLLAEAGTELSTVASVNNHFFNKIKTQLNEVKNQIPYDLWYAKLAESDDKIVDSLKAVIESFLNHDEITPAIKALLEYNRIIMKKRGGRAWVELDESGRIKRNIYQKTKPMNEEEVNTAWRNSYYLSSQNKLIQNYLGSTK